MSVSGLRRLLTVGVVTLLAFFASLVGVTQASAAPLAKSSTATAAAASSHPGLQCRSRSAGSGSVKIPSNYCYDPDTSSHPGWHDYCTHSPDSYGKADFRGPCARHDLCLQGGRSHGSCDGPLLSDLKKNCDSAYGSWNPLRYSCKTTAYEYYLAIKLYTLAT